MQAEIIDHIKFTTLSPEDIKKMSVAKLIVPDTYNEDGYPIDGGLIDQRMGIVDPGLKCKTCGGRSKTCTGHFGHIELVRPVVHPEFAKTIYFLFQTTCYSCHKILLSGEQLAASKERLSSLVTSDDSPIMNTQEQAQEARGVVKKAKHSNKCPYCAAKQKKIKFERPTMFYADGERIKPDEIRDWLSKISDEDLKSLGMDAAASRPEWFIITTLLVPPVNVRPSITLETGERSEDDLTHKLVEILRINKKLEQDIDAGTPQIIIDDLWELLQYHVTTYFNNETPGVPVARHRSSRPLKTIAQRLKGKEGRLRYNLSGKRVNFSARTVISVDASLTINQVGVPKRIAENLSVPIYVTKWNMEECKKLLQRKEYPMIINVITKEGLRKRLGEANREELIASIDVGHIIERQLIDGDIVLFNRQPTLHKHSIMAHKVKVLPGRTMRIHTSATTPYNADFDGDEMNLHVPQSLEAQAEARYLMQPKDILLSPREGKPIMTTEEDELIGIYHLTKDNAFFTKEEACRMLSSINVYELPKAERNGSYSGKLIFSKVLPEDFSFEMKLQSGNVVIKKGVLEEGVIDERMVGERGAHLILTLFERYGPEFIADFILNVTKLSLRAAYKEGVTLSIKDYYNTQEMNDERTEIINDVESKTMELIQRYRDNKLEALIGYTKKQTLEILTSTRLREARSMASSMLRKSLDMNNNAYLMSRVGARGNILNFVQISMFLGQQDVRGKRPSRGYYKRLLPYFKRGSKDPKAKGFVTSNYVNGLHPTDYYMHAMGARDSAVSKTLVVPKSGYMYRRLLNAMQDFYVDTNLSVKDASGSLIQTLYGGNGIDPSMELLAKNR
jgi:DNA-directed RNA polymerase subunit A'